MPPPPGPSPGGTEMRRYPLPEFCSLKICILAYYKWKLQLYCIGEFNNDNDKKTTKRKHLCVKKLWAKHPFCLVPFVPLYLRATAWQQCQRSNVVKWTGCSIVSRCGSMTNNDSVDVSQKLTKPHPVLAPRSRDVVMWHAMTHIRLTWGCTPDRLETMADNVAVNAVGT